MAEELKRVKGFVGEMDVEIKLGHLLAFKRCPPKWLAPPLHFPYDINRERVNDGLFGGVQAHFTHNRFLFLAEDLVHYRVVPEVAVSSELLDQHLLLALVDYLDVDCPLEYKDYVIYGVAFVKYNLSIVVCELVRLQSHLRDHEAH